MFDSGAKFKPSRQSEMGRNAPIKLSGGVFSRQAYLGQATTTRPVTTQATTQTTTTPVAQPDMDVPSGKAQRVGPMAWGRLKKLEAKELADQLALLTERMRRVGIPHGILEQIKDELAAFANSADANAEIEITADEARQIDEAILQLEVAERGGEVESSGASPALIVAGLGLGALLLFSL